MLIIVILFVIQNIASAAPLTILPSGRVVENFSPRFILSLDDDMQQRLQGQLIMDEISDEYTPKTTLVDFMSLKERTIIGNVTLSKIFSVSETSVIFEMDEFPHLIIKYQMECDDAGTNVHPLLRDAWYGELASLHDFSPGVIAVSPPAVLCPELKGKCAFQIAPETYIDCNRGTVRYMIVAKSFGRTLHQVRGDPLYALPNGSLGFRNSLTMGIRMLELLERLNNETGLIHGDIHAGNVMVTGASGNKTSGFDFSLELIDFGMAAKVANTTLPNTRIYPVKYWYHRLCTPWQILGFAWGRRDDIMKTLYTIYDLMHPQGKYSRFAQELMNRVDHALIHWKLNDRIYVTRYHDPITALTVSYSAKQQLFSLMDRALFVARTMRLNGPSPYSELIDLFRECIHIHDTHLV